MQDDTPNESESPRDDDYRRAPDPDDYPVPEAQPGPADEPPQAEPLAEASASAAGPTFVSVPCTQCGYNLTGIAIGGNCPECGARVDDSLYASGNTTPANGFAITSLVLGIISVVGLCCCWGGLLGILGLIFGGIAMRQVKTGNYANSSYGMALAGLICSGIALAGTLAFVLLAIIG